MSLATRIMDRFRAKEDHLYAQVGLAGEVFATELRVVLGKQGTREKPSRPGEAPHRVTGELVNSIVVRPGRRGEVRVGPTAAHGKYLLPTRPFYRIAADNCRARMRAILYDE